MTVGVGRGARVGVVGGVATRVGVGAGVGVAEGVATRVRVGGSVADGDGAAVGVGVLVAAVTALGLGLGGRVGVGVNRTITGPAVPGVEANGVAVGCRTAGMLRVLAPAGLGFGVGLDLGVGEGAGSPVSVGGDAPQATIPSERIATTKATSMALPTDIQLCPYTPAGCYTEPNVRFKAYHARD